MQLPAFCQLKCHKVRFDLGAVKKHYRICAVVFRRSRFNSKFLMRKIEIKSGLLICCSFFTAPMPNPGHSWYTDFANVEDYLDS
jgi:hypothetical protein